MWHRCRFAKLDALQKSAFENKRTPPLRGAVGTFTSPMSFLITTWVSHSCHSQNLLTSKKSLPAAMAEWKYGIREMKQMLLTGLFFSTPRLVQPNAVLYQARKPKKMVCEPACVGDPASLHRPPSWMKCLSTQTIWWIIWWMCLRLPCVQLKLGEILAESH